MLCILCRTVPDHPINIFAGSGIRLNVKQVIAQHFGLEPKSDDPNSQFICSSCWIALDKFHKFYETIQGVHRHLEDECMITEMAECEAGTFTITDFKVDCAAEARDAEDAAVSVDSSLYLSADKENGFNFSEMDIPSGGNNQEKEHSKETLPKAKESELKLLGNQCLDDYIGKNIQLSCYTCKMVLPTFSELIKHFHCEHKERGYIQCCGKKFFKRGILAKHLYLHNNQFECDKGYAIRKNLQKHVLTHKTRRFTCDQCAMSFFKEELLVRHIQGHTIRPCSKFKNSHERNELSDLSSASSSKPEEGNMRSVHTQANTLHKCDICNKVTRSAIALRYHILNMHRKDPITKNPAWGKILTGRQKMNTIANENMYSCPYCPKKFIHMSTMHSHHKDAHPDTWEQTRNRYYREINGSAPLKQ